jgi:uncharacterized protein YijF (DUF1287 family)
MKRIVVLVLLLIAMDHSARVRAQARPDIEAQTSLSQTALWLGDIVTYTVSLTCRPGVEVLQEDLGADKLVLVGLQVVDYTVNRRVAPDETTHFEIAYRLTTYDPGVETRRIGDWTVRYARGADAAGGSAPARDLRIPGTILAWRSALSGPLRTLDVRGARPADPAPRWWSATRPAGIGLLAVGSCTLVWLLMSRAATMMPVKPRRRVHRDSARELRSSLDALRQMDVGDAASRIAAYGALESAIRRHAANVTALPISALTPAEFRDRLGSSTWPFSADDVTSVLAECQQARYQPVERLPGEVRFRATLDSASALFAEPQ